MCFGGGSIPMTQIKYEKPDFGELPSLSAGPQQQRRGAKYGQVRIGQEQRSLLMPYSTGGSQ
jgi:hypothetical protein